MTDAAEPEDIVLLDRWRAGDEEAGQALFARHFDSIYGFFETKCESDADELTQVDPGHAGDHAAASDALQADLGALDAAYREGLAGCRGRTLVTSHEAFGYLAERYGLVQVGIAGLDPAVEPSPARLRDVVEVVEGRDVRTVYF